MALSAPRRALETAAARTALMKEMSDGCVEDVAPYFMLVEKCDSKNTSV